MRWILRIVIMAVAMVLCPFSSSGCSPRPVDMSPGPDHPANPDAMAASLPERSTGLTTASEPTTDGPRDRHMHGGSTAAAPASSSAPATNAAAIYVCPMHPEVTSDQPDQRCPKCGMKLVRKSEGGEQP